MVVLAVRRRQQYTLSLRDLPTLFLERGIDFTHQAVRGSEERYAPLLTEHLWPRRRGKAGRRWCADETYVQVFGRPCYPYRYIDRDGNLVNPLLSEHRDIDAAKRFFVQPIGAVAHGRRR